jgi:cytoskeletal protein RodZ
MGDELNLKKLSKILSILLMVALLVTVNFDVYAKTRSGGFKSSSSSSSKSSSSSSSKSSGGFKSSSGYTKPSTKPSTSTTKPSTTSNNSTSTGTNNVYRSNNRSYLPMIFFGNSFGSTILRYIGLMIILAIAFYVYRFLKRKKH